MRRALLPLLALARAGAYDVRILVSWDIRGALFPVDGQQDACTAAQLGASPCGCVGGPARRLGALEAARAGGAEALALDGGASFYGVGQSNFLLPSVTAAASQHFLAASRLSGWGAAYRDFRIAESETALSHEMGGRRALADYIAAARALDPDLPPLTVTNLNASATNGDLGPEHFSSYTIMSLPSGRRIALLALTDPTYLSPEWAAACIPYERAVETALAELRRLPSPPDATILIGALPKADALTLARETIGLAAVLAPYQGKGEQQDEVFQIVQNWAGDRVLVGGRSGPFGAELSDVTLSLGDDGFLESGSATRMELDCNVTVDATHQASMLDFRRQMDEKLDEQPGFLAEPLDGREFVVPDCPDTVSNDICAQDTLTCVEPVLLSDGRSACGCRVSECSAGNFVADAARHAAGADIAVINSGAIRSDAVPQAPTAADLYDLMPFLSDLHRVDVSGAVVRATLENSVSRMASFGRLNPNNPSGRFLQVSGLTFSWGFEHCPLVSSQWQPVIHDVTVGGQPLTDGATYSIAISSWLAEGGDGFAMLEGLDTQNRNVSIARATMDFLQDVAPTAPQAWAASSEQRIMRLPTSCGQVRSPSLATPVHIAPL